MRRRPSTTAKCGAEWGEGKTVYVDRPCWPTPYSLGRPAAAAYTTEAARIMPKTRRRGPLARGRAGADGQDRH